MTIRRTFHRGLCYIMAILIIPVLATGCSGSHSSKRHHTSGKGQSVTKVRFPSDISKDRKSIVQEAERWIGTPYKYAGYDRNGTDCSGMVLTIYDEVLSIKIPRNSAKQAEFCKKISSEDVRPGDLVFFATGKDPDRISHVGIMLNDNDFVHSSTSKGVVISQVETPYYQRTFKMFGRVPGIQK